MRSTQLIITAFLLSSCLISNNSFEKEFYEKVSGISFPDSYQLLETFNNGEFLKGTVLQIDSLTLKHFIKENNFTPLQSLHHVHLFSNSYLNKYKAEFKSIKNIYYVSRSGDKHNWVYIADLDNHMLWAEISYPDWGGQ